MSKLFPTEDKVSFLFLNDFKFNNEFIMWYLCGKRVK